MKILTINCGSSSLKFKVFNMYNEELLASGLAERIGLSEKGALMTYKNYVNNEKTKETIPARKHSTVLNYILDMLVHEKYGVLRSISEIRAVGHRILHGKDVFKKSALITQEDIFKLKEFIEMGPLHMPANITGIEACMEKMPSVPNVGVFDTSFHQTMEAEAYMYGLPYEYYSKYGVRRYGFHGTSHKYITHKLSEILDKPLNSLNAIIMHIGNGASISAIKNGKVIDTSMGFTPLEGIMMGTRSGDMDPAIILFLMHKLNITIEEIDTILNKKSGLLGLSGFSNDMRDIVKNKDNIYNAKIAYDVYIYKIIKYIGAYYAAINDDLDGIVFTAGVGENSKGLRLDVCKKLSHFSIELDESKNNLPNESYRLISSENSKIKIFVIPTDEELMIAKDTYDIYKKINSETK
jgi:acetate kinase